MTIRHRADPARFLHDPEPPPVTRKMVDAHVHLFPPRVFAAIWRWFDAHGWPIRYRYDATEVLAFLRAQHVEAVWGLVYSHVPGMARALNSFVSDLALRVPMVVPFGTVLPGEPGAEEIVADALDDLGCAGLKIHCHVQKVAPDDPRLFPVYEALSARGKVLVMHAGREPSSEAYGFDTRGRCGIAPVRRVVERYPELKLVVPHLGQDQWHEFMALAREAPSVYLDTTMALSGYLSEKMPTADDLVPIADRLLFGTDFPNLPYPWGREYHRLLALGLPEDALEKILVGNARRLVGTAGVAG